MRHRFFVPDPIESGAIIALGDEERHHARVLRVRPGEEVEVFDASGRNFLARYQSPDEIQIVQTAENRELRSAIHLAMSIIQLEKFEFVLQKGTELGVQSFVPLVTDRMEVRIERMHGKEERWRKIVLEAVKQSGRSKIPAIASPARFEDVLACDGQKIIFDADSQPTTRQPGNPITLLIGPEGGWSERELEMARASDAMFEQLGPRRLRAETAAIVAVAVVAARSGDI